MSYLKSWEKVWITDMWSKGSILGDIEIEKERCIGCGLCVRACPGDSLVLDADKRPAPNSEVELSCAACGACMAICPEEAINVTRKMTLTGKFKTLRRGPLSRPRLFEELADKPAKR